MILYNTDDDKNDILETLYDGSGIDMSLIIITQIGDIVSVPQYLYYKWRGPTFEHFSFLNTVHSTMMSIKHGMDVSSCNNENPT